MVTLTPRSADKPLNRTVANTIRDMAPTAVQGRLAR